MNFDATTYKNTTRHQWDAAAEAWHRWGPTIEDWLAESTTRMLDDARVGPGSRVLDLAAGAGGQSLLAARRTGRSGHVVATDISAEILTYAARSAKTEGLDNVETAAADGEHLEQWPDGSFDSVICRLGLMFLPDPGGALHGIHRVLRDDGWFSAVVYTSPHRNGFFAVPVSIIRSTANLPAPPPGTPGPFALADAHALADTLTGSGFADVTVSTLDAPLRLGSAAECVRFQQESFGALHQMMSGLSESDKAATWAQIEDELSAFEDEQGFAGPCELHVVAGRRATR